MSSESREQILADFTECTGLENVGECIAVLEQYQWNLLNAVQAVLERIGSGSEMNHSSTVPKQATTTTKYSSIVKRPSQINKARRYEDSDDNDDPDEPKIIKSVPGSNRATAGAVRELRFDVEYKDRTEHIKICDNETIRQLQSKIHEKLGVSANRQKFTNSWSRKPYTDHTILKDLNLPQENEIHLVQTLASTTNGASRSSTTSTTTTNSRTHRHPVSSSKNTSIAASAYFPITVLYEDKFGKSTPHELVLPPTTTIADMKKQIEQATHLPVRQQNWVGLMNAKDSDEIQNTSIRRKAHLTVRQLGSSSTPQAATTRRDVKNSTLNKRQLEDEPMEIGSEIDLEHFDDDMNMISHHISNAATTTGLSSNREFLIPDRCTDDIVGLEHFIRVFHARFGSTGPILYIGSLDQAIQESVLASRNERRPLAIYIHNDRSVCANVFCAQVLAGETIVEYLASNYVVWAWDITCDSNRTRLLESFKRCIGHQYAQRIATMDKDAYPLLLVLIRSRGSLELVSTIEGNSTPSEVLFNLIQSHDLFEQQRQRDEGEEIMREKREDLKKQQEDEYHQSLQADLAKEQARLADERREKEEQNAKEQREKQRLQQQRECIARLPAEPNETEKNTTRLKIRLPDDEGILMRRFHISDTLQILFDYLTSQGRMFGEYKLLSTYPKRDLTTLNRSDTFEQLKLYPQEQLILESL